MTSSTITVDTREVVSHLVLKVRFGVGHKVRLWLAARLVSFAGLVAGCTVVVELDDDTPAAARWPRAEA